MDTAQLKKFATEARTSLRNGIIQKIATLGFDAQGRVPAEMLPIQGEGFTNFGGRIIAGEAFYKQWMALYHDVQQKGVRQVYEEVAYTWFNRLVAIRILQKNNLLPVAQVFEPVNGVPAIVENARNGRIPGGLTEIETRELNILLNDPLKVQEQFAILIKAFCHDTPLINRIFGRLDDYSELLLPDNILANGGLVDLILNTPYITDEDYTKTELIGWLYQFYISERKVEAYRNNGEWSVEEVEAGTQIFTPSWIVKYMVENTLGRIYLDNNPDSDLGKEMKYLVERSEGEHPVFEFENIEEIRCADFSCGSGHILGEFFDLLYRIYTDEKWYDSRDAIESIFKNNIAGIDLDTRATQLSTFALLLKACQKDNSFVNSEVMPNVLDMPSVAFDRVMLIVNELFYSYNADIKREVTHAFDLIVKAEELGSIMKFDLSKATRKAMQSVVADYRAQANADLEIVKSIDLMLMLTEKYSAICMNPPYMGSTHMNDLLKSYVGSNYPYTKADLYAVFMDVAIQRLKENAKFGMINMQNWMFIPAFKHLRPILIEQYSIDSLMQLGSHLFDELAGERVQSVAFVVTNCKEHTSGTYYRLINGKNCSDKESLFLQNSYRYKSIDQNIFKSIPNNVFCFWLNENIVASFENRELSSYCSTRCGLATGRNEYYIRTWQEVAYKAIGRNMNRTSAQKSQLKWFPYNSAGGFRKWYGFQTDVIDWYNDGDEMQHTLHPSGNRIWAHNFNLDKIFKEHIGWSDITTGTNTFRYYPSGFLFTSNAAFFDDTKYINLLIAFANSCIAPYFKEVLNPGLHFTPGNFEDLPFCYSKINFHKDLGQISTDCIYISKLDWDSHETSWDFLQSPLLEIQQEIQNNPSFQNSPNLLKSLVEKFCAVWEEKFMQLHANEEELNRQFIDIYGLKDEVTPDVPLDEITILQQGEISIENNQIVWHKDVLMKQFISYAMGCWMGRYRLDKPGLNIAHPDPTPEELAAYDVNGNTFEIDDDAIIPLMPESAPFPDNAVKRFREFLRITMGDKNLGSNENYAKECLGKSIEDYLIKDFWKDHLSRYQKRPIYWLFQSKKKAFQVLVYMHRMNPYTCEKIRQQYLLPYIDHLAHQITTIEQSGAVTRAEMQRLKKLKEAREECIDYESKLHTVADQQISFDLDDGVVENYKLFDNVVAIIR